MILANTMIIRGLRPEKLVAIATNNLIMQLM